MIFNKEIDIPLLILSRKSENYNEEKESFAGELFIVDDRFKDDIIDIFYIKKEVKNRELYKCPFCGSYTNVVEKTYYDNNGVVGSALVCPYCWDIERRDVDTEEKVERHFNFIKKDILNKRLNK